MEDFNSLLRGAIIGLLIITYVKVSHIERTVDAISEAWEVAKSTGRQ